MIKKVLICLFFFINFGLIVFFWWTSSGTLLTGGIGNLCLSLGRLSGLLAVYFILLQLLFIGRSSWLEEIFGLDKLSRIHHLNGNFSLLFIILHPILLSVGYASRTNNTLWRQFFFFLTDYENIPQAAVGTILFIFIIFLSIYLVRKRLKYEYWYFIHLLTYLAIILVWFHQLILGGDFIDNKPFVAYWYFWYLFTFGNLFFFRFFKPLYFFSKHQFMVSDLVKEADGVTSVYISGKKLKQFHVQPGQFMIFRFLCRDFWWQAHPFSLSAVLNGNILRITVKNVGDFTGKILTIPKRTKVFIDGPYGVFTSKFCRRKKILFIAGGIGITPIRSLIEEMVEANKDLTLLYANKTVDEIVFKSELERLAGNHRFPIHYIISQDKHFKGEKGRIDEEKLNRLIPDLKEREIYLCGPEAFTKTVLDIFKKVGLPHSQIHFEKFSL